MRRRSIRNLREYFRAEGRRDIRPSGTSIRKPLQATSESELRNILIPENEPKKRQKTQQYYVRLHEQALKCDFDDKDKELKQQIELSTNSSKLRKYSFQNPRTLHELVTTAKTFETMKIQTEEIKKHSENEDVSKISRRKFATEKTIRNEQHPQAERQQL